MSQQNKQSQDSLSRTHPTKHLANLRTKTRQRIQRQTTQPEKEPDTSLTRLSQASTTSQHQPSLTPNNPLPIANYTTLRPTTTLGHAPATLQTKLTVNDPNDQYEVEADRVADNVMRMPSGDLTGWQTQAPTPPTLQLENETAMRVGESQPPTITPAIERNIQRMQGRGKPLDNNTQSFFEQRMGADFSQVRIHTDSNAIQTSRDINARAFTVGNNIAFNSGEYSPNTHTGKHLLAHELTHTLQQTSQNNVQTVSKSIQREDEPEPFSQEDGERFQQAYVAQADNCMVAVYEGLGSLYGDDYSDDLKQRVYSEARKVKKETGKNTNTINRLMDTVQKDGKAGEKVKLQYKYKQNWEPEPEATVLGMTSKTAGWYFFGFSLHDAYHSVILAVDKTDVEDIKLYWADQNASGLQDVTGQLKEQMLSFEPSYGYHHCYIWPLIPPSGTKVEEGE